MRKRLSLILLGISIIGVLFIGCNSREDNKKVLKVGASLTPHSEILEQVKPKLKEQGIDLQIVNFDADEQLNPALNDKLIDANYGQHLPALQYTSKEKGYDFEVAGKVHVEPIGLYSNKIKSINDLKDGALIGIPNNPSNEYRALKLLELNGLIKLKDGLESYTATPNDIIENTKHLKFSEIDAPQLPRSLPDLDGAIINTNIALEAKIDTNTALIREDANSPYANIIVVRKGDKDREDIKKLMEALNSDDIKKFINEKYKGAVVPAF